MKLVSTSTTVLVVLARKFLARIPSTHVPMLLLHSKLYSGAMLLCLRDVWEPPRRRARAPAPSRRAANGLCVRFLLFLAQVYAHLAGKLIRRNPVLSTGNRKATVRNGHV